MSQPIAKLTSIISAYGLIADRSDRLTKTRLEGGAPLRRIEASRFHLPHPENMGERARPGNDLIDRLAPTGTKQVIRILTFGQAGEFQAFSRLEQRQCQIDGPICGAPSSIIAVEAKHRLVRDFP